MTRAIPASLSHATAGIEYALGLLEDTAGVADRLGSHITYTDRPIGEPGWTGVRFVPSEFFQENYYGTPKSLPQLPLPELVGVPILYGTPRIVRSGNELVVHADLPASAYFLATRYEEMVRRDVRDEHGRFPGRESLPFRVGSLHRPIIEEYAVLLRRWLLELGVDVPAAKPTFSVLLTHDVDTMRKYRNPLRTAASAALGRQPVRNVGESLASALGLARDPYDNLHDIMALDEMVSAPTRSVYFVMGGGRSQHDGRYDVAGSRARALMRQISTAGAEVGLHSSYEAGLHPERIAIEKAALERAAECVITGNRHHFLAWREIEDGRSLVESGITWDATLGYADVAGFRLGVCHPIPLFDPISMRPLGIEEHPLIVMDCTLDRPGYMGLDDKAAYQYCVGLMEQTRRFGGEFVMLWHNTSLAPSVGNYHPQLYRRLLDHANGPVM